MIPQALVNEMELRCGKVAKAIALKGYDAILISSNANLYYLSGRVFSGYVYISATGVTRYFVRRPVGLQGDYVTYIRKPEDFAQLIGENPKRLALELDTLSYNDTLRLSKIFPDTEIVDGSAVMRSVRSVKTPFEIAKLKESGVHHDMIYSRIHSLYREGMTDLELQIEIERQLRLDGSLGIFRIAGQSMEIFMGNVLCGDNADVPSPYDFALGGAGLDESLPVGCNGTTIKPGMTVMVDMLGNFNGYMTDMTRVFYVGHLDDTARRAHELSIAIHHRLAKGLHAGLPASEAYSIASQMADEAGLGDYFMGHRHHAAFVGHGVGIEINELPVLSLKSRDVLQEGNVIAIEPKFVIPHVGAVGIENTYVVRADKLERITNLPEELVELY